MGILGSLIDTLIEVLASTRELPLTIIKGLLALLEEVTMYSEIEDQATLTVPIIRQFCRLPNFHALLQRVYLIKSPARQ